MLKTVQKYEKAQKTLNLTKVSKVLITSRKYPTKIPENAQHPKIPKNSTKLKKKNPKKYIKAHKRIKRPAINVLPAPKYFYILSEIRMLRNDYFMFFFKTVVCKSASKASY